MMKRELNSKTQLVDQLAQQLNDWGMAQPALFVLEATRPFSFLASQGLLLCEPVLSALWGEPQITDLANLLADRTSVDRLIACLERDGPLRGTAREEGR